MQIACRTKAQSAWSADRSSHSIPVSSRSASVLTSTAVLLDVCKSLATTPAASAEVSSHSAGERIACKSRSASCSGLNCIPRSAASPSFAQFKPSVFSISAARHEPGAASLLQPSAEPGSPPTKVPTPEHASLCLTACLSGEKICLPALQILHIPSPCSSGFDSPVCSRQKATSVSANKLDLLLVHEVQSNAALQQVVRITEIEDLKTSESWWRAPQDTLANTL